MENSPVLIQNQNLNENKTNERMNSYSYTSENDGMSLIIHLLENIHWILLAGIICAAIAAFYVLKMATPLYKATSKIYIVTSESSISLSDLQIGSSIARDYLETFNIWHVHEMVDERLNLDYSYNQLAGMVSAENPNGTHLLYINVTSPDPEEAKLLADAYAEVLQEFIAEKMDLRRPRVVEKALTPTQPSSPRVNLTIVAGFAVGAFLAVTFIVIQFILDDRIKSETDVQNVSGLATFGMVNLQNENKNSTEVQPEISTELTTAQNEQIANITRNLELDYEATETINAICSSISFSGRNLKRIAVTGYEANSGKTFISLHIAMEMAKRGKKVLLIDADLRKSVMLRHYKIVISGDYKGLAHYLSGQCDLNDAIYQTNIPNLSLMPVGEIVKNPIPLLTSEDMNEMMDTVSEQYDLVLVDTPPIGIVIDAAEIARYCNGALLVVHHNKSTRSELSRMQKLIEQTGTPILGVIINKVSMGRLSRHRYGYYYGDYYYYGQKEGENKSEHSDGHHNGSEK